MCVRTCVRAYVHACMRPCVRACVRDVCVRPCVRACVCTCVFAHVHARFFTCACACVRARVHAYMLPDAHVHARLRMCSSVLPSLRVYISASISPCARASLACVRACQSFAHVHSLTRPRECACANANLKEQRVRPREPPYNIFPWGWSRRFQAQGDQMSDHRHFQRHGHACAQSAVADK